MNDIIVFQLQCLSIVLGTTKWSHYLLNKFFEWQFFFGILSSTCQNVEVMGTYYVPTPLPAQFPPQPPSSLLHITLQSGFLTRSLPAWQLHAIQYCDLLTYCGSSTRGETGDPIVHLSLIIFSVWQRCRCCPFCKETKPKQNGTLKY